jgi:hypothetical protein
MLADGLEQLVPAEGGENPDGFLHLFDFFGGEVPPAEKHARFDSVQGADLMKIYPHLSLQKLFSFTSPFLRQIKNAARPKQVYR